MNTGSSTVLPPELRADCARCTGLCCVALPFDAVQGFGFDKPAHTPCPHLCDDFRCGIHASLDAKGFRGCVVFDCHGAGQRVSQQLFPGQDWSTSADTGQQMFEAFSAVSRLHELMGWLYTAEQHVQDSRLAQRRAQIDRLCNQLPLTRAQVEEARRGTLALLSEPAISAALKALPRSA